MLRTIAFTITILGFAATASAEQICVPAQYSTIQAAVANASDGDEILVDEGIYHEAIDFLGKAIALRSVAGPECTVIDGSGFDTSVVKCVSWEDADTVLDGFTVTGGTGTQDATRRKGGGLFNRFAGPTIRNCIFTDNTAEFGGGIGSFGGWPTITDCIFIHNTATAGGEFGGGGVGGLVGTTTIRNCVFIENVATGVAQGGGLAVAGEDVEVVNCLFYANEAFYGGGMRNESCTATIVNCTFVDNVAGNCGGGMRCVYDSAQTSLVNCIFRGNAAPYGDEILDQSGAQTTVIASNVQGGWAGPGGGNIDADPMFVDAAGGDLHLLPDSPCIDAGNTAFFLECGLPCDLEGNPRPVAGHQENGLRPRQYRTGVCLTPAVDMGAYEFQP